MPTRRRAGIKVRRSGGARAWRREGMEARRCANIEVLRPRGMEAGMPACRRAGVEV